MVTVQALPMQLLPSRLSRTVFESSAQATRLYSPGFSCGMSNRMPRRLELLARRRGVGTLPRRTSRELPSFERKNVTLDDLPAFAVPALTTLTAVEN